MSATLEVMPGYRFRIANDLTWSAPGRNDDPWAQRMVAMLDEAFGPGYNPPRYQPDPVNDTARDVADWFAWEIVHMDPAPEPRRGVEQ